MGCGEVFVKYVLFITNLVFALGGLALLGLGIAAQLNVSAITNLAQSHVEIAPIFTMVVGSIVFLISFFGCCGAIRESNCMLITYAILMLVLMALKIALSVLIFVNIPKLESEISRLLQESFQEPDRRPFYELQESFQCCGTTGPESYTFINQPLPPSCCPQNNTVATLECLPPNAFDGCNGVIYDFFRSFGTIMASVALVIVAIELIAVVFGCCLASHVRNKDRRTRY